MMEDIIILIIVAVIVVLAGFYIFNAKKNGKKCIGCPYSDKCGTNNQTSCCGSCFHPAEENTEDI